MITDRFKKCGHGEVSVKNSVKCFNKVCGCPLPSTSALPGNATMLDGPIAFSWSAASHTAFLRRWMLKTEAKCNSDSTF